MLNQITKILITLLIIFFLTIFFVGLKKKSIYDTKNLVGQEISSINLKNLNENKTITTQDIKIDKYTLINFWASWCTPCLYEHPYLLKLHKEKNITILGINYNDEQKNALKFLNDNGNPYHFLAKDHSGKQSINFGIYGIPESILLDRNLIIIEKFIGPISKEDFEHIKKIIKKI